MSVRPNVVRLVLLGAGALALALTTFSLVLDRIILANVKVEMREVLEALRNVDRDYGGLAQDKVGMALLRSLCRELPRFSDGFIFCLNPDRGEVVATGSPRTRAGDHAADVFKDFESIRGGPLGEYFVADVHGVRSYCLMLDLDALRLVAVVPCAAVTDYRNMPLFVAGPLLFALVGVFTFGAIRRSRLLQRLRGYIEGENTRLQEDLSAAQLVQVSALPPPFPRQPAFMVSARMDPAKVVGGDFYDYQILPNGCFYFLVADVSGKGISAAMFMMRAKSVIKQCLAETGDLAKGMTKANALLAANNDSKIFVTVWVGVLNPRTGHIVYVNAGHNPPAVRRTNGGRPAVEWVTCPPSLVMALCPDVSYPVRDLTLAPGDSLFLYTDGVTEAQDEAGRLYGEERLARRLMAVGGCSVEDVREDLDDFQGKAEPADDVTMVLLNYLGTPPGSERGFPCNRDVGFIESSRFLENELVRVSCPAEIRTKFLLAYDEVGSNVISYSGAEYFTLKVAYESTPEAITLTVTDSGSPFNPLDKAAPDPNLSLEKRMSGGFGIFITRQLMDEVIYCRDGGLNVLTLRKLCHLAG